MVMLEQIVVEELRNLLGVNQFYGLRLRADAYRAAGL